MRALHVCVAATLFVRVFLAAWGLVRTFDMFLQNDAGIKWIGMISIAYLSTLYLWFLLQAKRAIVRTVEQWDIR